MVRHLSQVITFCSTSMLLALAGACIAPIVPSDDSEDGQALEIDPPNEVTDPGFEPPSDPCDGLNNDGDDRVDEDCYCDAGETQSCFPGIPGQEGVGQCLMGTQLCIGSRGDIQFGTWGTCEGAVTATPEICGNLIDEDCDGFAAPCQDDTVTGLPCHPGETASCYTGPAGTAGFGQCREGIRHCGVGDLWESCSGETLPSPEVCQNGVDENCDGSDNPC